MKPKAWMTLPLVLVGLLVGCIEFQTQTMTFRYDAGSDTLYIFQDYQGIFGGEDSAKLSQDEQDQLTSVLQGERTFFFNNWISEFNRSAVVEALGKAKESDDDEKLDAAFRAFGKLALDSIKIENVGFYKDKEGHLGGAQRVTVKHVTKLLPALNATAREFIRVEAAKEETTAADRALAMRFVERNLDILQLNGNQLTIRWPFSPDDLTSFKGSEQGKAFLHSGGKIESADGFGVLTLGEAKAASTTVTMPFSTNAWSANAMSDAQRFGIKETFDPVAAAKDFLEPKPASK